MQGPTKSHVMVYFLIISVLVGPSLACWWNTPTPATTKATVATTSPTGTTVTGETTDPSATDSTSPTDTTPPDSTT